MFFFSNYYLLFLLFRQCPYISPNCNRVRNMNRSKQFNVQSNDDEVDDDIFFCIVMIVKLSSSSRCSSSSVGSKMLQDWFFGFPMCALDNVQSNNNKKTTQFCYAKFVSCEKIEEQRISTFIPSQNSKKNFILIRNPTQDREKRMKRERQRAEPVVLM